MNLGEVRNRLSAFAAGIEATGPVKGPEKKITLVNGASFTPVELVKLDRILGYFPADVDCSAIMVLNGAIARVLNITNSSRGPAYDPAVGEGSKMIEGTPAGSAPDDEPLNVA